AVEWAERLIWDVPDRADDRNRREVGVLRGDGLRNSIRAARATRDVGAFALEMRIQHQDPILGFREAHEVPPQRLRDLPFRRNMMVRDDRVEAVQRAQHPRAEIADLVTLLALS